MGKPTKNRPHNREIRKTYLNKTIQKVKVKALTHRESAQLERVAQIKDKDCFKKLLLEI